jgi:GNAT superfamily N-acetyltransferase
MTEVAAPPRVRAATDGDVAGIADGIERLLVELGGSGTLQDLWVDPEWRSRAVGRALLDALFELAREEGLPRIEVGLPQEGFAALEATRSFYLANGFKPLGPRMRRLTEDGGDG